MNAPQPMGNAVAKIVAESMAAVQPKDRAALLRIMLRHAAAGLVVIVGQTQAAEDLYRLADETVDRGQLR